MSAKEDALRRVLALQAQAASTPYGPEAEAFMQKSIELRLRHGISDADLEGARHDDNGEELSFFGHKLFWYSRQIKPRLDAIQAEIDRACRLISEEDLRTEVEELVRFTKDVKDLAEKLRDRRDDAIRRLYAENLEDRIKDYEEHEREEMKLSPFVHDSAIGWTKLATDMRADHIERIVGVSAKKLWERQLRNSVCERCGLDGNEGRDLVGLFDNPETGEREHIHSACTPAEVKA